MDDWWYQKKIWAVALALWAFAVFPVAASGTFNIGFAIGAALGAIILSGLLVAIGQAIYGAVRGTPSDAAAES